MNNIGQFLIGTALSAFLVSAMSLSPAGLTVAEDGAERTPGFRVAEDGAARTPGFRVAEGGSDRTAISRLG